MVEVGADIRPPKKSGVGGKIEGGGVVGPRNTGGEASGSLAGAIVGRGRFAGRRGDGGRRGGGDDDGAGVSSSGSAGDLSRVGAGNGKGRRHNPSASTGGAADLSAVALGPARSGGVGRHGAFGGGDGVLKLSVGPSGGVSVEIGGTGRNYHSVAAGGSAVLTGDGVGGRHCGAEELK